jgi:diguanylate cyclase (GGDEF)-like protein
MGRENFAAAGDMLLKYLHDTMYASSKPVPGLDVERLPEELRYFGSGLRFFAEQAARRIKLLEEHVCRDPLTKTYNRYWGMETMNGWIRAGRRFLVCFIGVDHLKYVNDRFGHSAGDAYILRVADILRNSSEGALISRLGGDEFMLLDVKRDIQFAEARLEEIRKKLREQKPSEDAIHPYSISYGVVETDKDNALPAGELLAMADEKMYEYKRARRAARAGTAPAA